MRVTFGDMMNADSHDDHCSCERCVEVMAWRDLYFVVGAKMWWRFA